MAIAPEGLSTIRAVAARLFPNVAAWSSLRAAWRSNLNPCASAACFSVSRCSSKSAIPSSGSKCMQTSRSRDGLIAPMLRGWDGDAQAPSDCAPALLFLHLSHDDQALPPARGSADDDFGFGKRAINRPEGPGTDRSHPQGHPADRRA